MANITWTPPNGWVEETGTHVSFKAPCDSADAQELVINNHQYTIVDAYGNTVAGVESAFVNNAIVEFVLDYENLKAYIQNASTSLFDLGGISMTKVWETSTPNANYVSGTINVDLSDYDLALVMFYGFPDEHHIVSTFVTIGGGMGCVYFDTTQLGGGTNASRRFVVNSTNIVFARMWNSQSENSTGGALTPFRVYGIKGIQTI